MTFTGLVKGPKLVETMVLRSQILDLLKAHMYIYIYYIYYIYIIYIHIYWVHIFGLFFSFFKKICVLFFSPGHFSLLFATFRSKNLYFAEFWH